MLPSGYDALELVGLDIAAAAWGPVWEGITRPRSEERGKDKGDGEWTKESMLGVWTTGAGV